MLLSGRISALRVPLKGLYNAKRLPAIGTFHMDAPRQRSYAAATQLPIPIVFDPKFTIESYGQGFSTLRRSYSTKPTTTEPSPSTSSTEPETKLSKKEQLKRAFKEYGGTIVAFHVGISLVSLGGFYALVSSGINFVPVLEFLGIASSAIAEKVATGSTFVVAYAVHKVFAPVRISITLGSAPFIVRYLRSKGFLKPKPQAK